MFTAATTTTATLSPEGYLRILAFKLSNRIRRRKEERKRRGRGEEKERKRGSRGLRDS